LSGDLSVEEAEWLRIWKQLGQRINQFPEWMRTILLDDMDTAIRNRIAIFEMIQRKVSGA
jgi:hypothetical protein